MQINTIRKFEENDIRYNSGLNLHRSEDRINLIIVVAGVLLFKIIDTFGVENN